MDIIEELKDLGFYSLADSLESENPTNREYRFYAADIEKARRESTEEELSPLAYRRAQYLIDKYFELTESNQMKITKNQLREIILESLWANIHAKKARGEKSNPRSKSYQAAKKAGQKINRAKKKNEADDMEEKHHMEEVDKDKDGSPAKPKWAEEKGITPKWADPDDNDPKKTAKLKKESKHLPQYSPKSKSIRGMTRGEALDKTKEDLKKAKELRKKGKAGKAKELEQRAYNRRDRMEKKEREKNESITIPEDILREVIRSVLIEALSKKTKATLKKKAEKRGFTPGSVYREFEKGLAAYASSGSRKGMSAHQWAHARVNSATPSKPWAVVKKSKAKKKKKSSKKK
jgi:hypothetical protein